MDAVLRATLIFLVIMILFRVTGKRTMAQVTTFDFVLLLVVGEATQQALLGEDFSIVHAALVIATLVVLDRASDYLSWRWPMFKRAAESEPLILITDGEPVQAAMREANVSDDDILASARSSQGLERMDQIRYAVLETSGAISIVPKRQ
ncbi:MAG: DUF421 domain-containing protein [Actinomycetota bacterium]|nr:DUF421 domain-containing protein [Actinomycetota bacterium]